MSHAKWTDENISLQYFDHNCSPLDVNLSQMNPVNMLPSYLFHTHTYTHTHTHFSIIIPSLPRPLKRSLSLRFPHQIPLCITFYPMRDAFSTHLILLGLSTWSIWLSKFMKFLITHFSRAFCYILPLGPNISLSTFYSNICPLLNVRDQVSRGKIIAVYNSYLEDQIFWT